MSISNFSISCNSVPNNIILYLSNNLKVDEISNFSFVGMNIAEPFSTIDGLLATKDLSTSQISLNVLLVL